jgi:hypothetical protein
VRDAVRRDPVERILNVDQETPRKAIEGSTREGDDVVASEVVEYALDVLGLAPTRVEVRAPRQSYPPMVVFDLFPAPFREEWNERSTQLLNESTPSSGTVTVTVIHGEIRLLAWPKGRSRISLI